MIEPDTAKHREVWIADGRVWRKPYAAVIAVMLILSTLDLWDNNRHFIQTEPFSAYGNYLYNTPSDNFLTEQPRPFRTIQLNNELTVRMLNRSISSTHGYHPLTFQKYFDILDRTWFYEPLFIHLYDQQYVIARSGDKLPAGYDDTQRIAG